MMDKLLQSWNISTNLKKPNKKYKNTKIVPGLVSSRESSRAEGTRKNAREPGGLMCDG